MHKLRCAHKLVRSEAYHSIKKRFKTSRAASYQCITDACLTNRVDVGRAGCPLQHLQARLGRHPVADQAGGVRGGVVLLEDTLLAPGTETLVGGQELFL